MPAIVFADSRIPEQSMLMQGLPLSTRVVVIRSDAPGLAQMRNALRHQYDLDAINIVCHGAEGTLLLGDLPLHKGNLHDHTEELRAIGASLAQGGGGRSPRRADTPERPAPITLRRCPNAA